MAKIAPYVRRSTSLKRDAISALALTPCAAALRTNHAVATSNSKAVSVRFAVVRVLGL